MGRPPVVANRLPLQYRGMFQSIGHRAWHAYYCLPRDEKGRPPSYRSLEDKQVISNGGLQKLITGKLTRPGIDVFSKCAAALQVSMQWLQTGEGEPPRSAWPIPPYPHAKASGLSARNKATFESDTKKLSDGAVTRRVKGARK